MKEHVRSLGFSAKTIFAVASSIIPLLFLKEKNKELFCTSIKYFYIQIIIIIIQSSNFFRRRRRLPCRHHLSNWPLVQFPPPHKPIDQTEQQHKDKHRTSIIHVLGRDRLLWRKREEDADENRVYDGKNVHVEAQGAHPERAVRDRLAAELAEGEDDDGDNI